MKIVLLTIARLKTFITCFIDIFRTYSLEHENCFFSMAKSSDYINVRTCDQRNIGFQHVHLNFLFPMSARINFHSLSIMSLQYRFLSWSRSLRCPCQITSIIWNIISIADKANIALQSLFVDVSRPNTGSP